MTESRRTAAEPVYVLEIDGVPTLAFAARSHAEAMSLRKEAWFLDDLKSTRSHGQPLWDGKAPLKIRPATPELEARYQRAAEAIIDGSEDLFVCYLVELDR